MKIVEERKYGPRDGINMEHGGGEEGEEGRCLQFGKKLGETRNIWERPEILTRLN